jgi:hypothetical protein
MRRVLKRKEEQRPTHNAPPNLLRVGDGLELETVLEAGDAVCAGRGADCDNEFVVPALYLLVHG